MRRMAFERRRRPPPFDAAASGETQRARRPQRTKRTRPDAPSRCAPDTRGRLVEDDAADGPADQVPHAGFHPQPVVGRVAQHGRTLRAAVSLELGVGIDTPLVVQPVSGGILESGVPQRRVGHLVAADGRSAGWSGEAIAAGFHLFQHGEIQGKVGAAGRRGPRPGRAGLGRRVDRGPRRRGKRPRYGCARPRRPARGEGDGDRDWDCGRRRARCYGHEHYVNVSTDTGDSSVAVTPPSVAEAADASAAALDAAKSRLPTPRALTTAGATPRLHRRSFRW